MLYFLHVIKRQELFSPRFKQTKSVWFRYLFIWWKKLITALKNGVQAASCPSIFIFYHIFSSQHMKSRYIGLLSALINVLSCHRPLQMLHPLFWDFFFHFTHLTFLRSISISLKSFQKFPVIPSKTCFHDTISWYHILVFQGLCPNLDFVFICEIFKFNVCVFMCCSPPNLPKSKQLILWMVSIMFFCSFLFQDVSGTMWLNICCILGICSNLYWNWKNKNMHTYELGKAQTFKSKIKINTTLTSRYPLRYSKPVFQYSNKMFRAFQ